MEKSAYTPEEILKQAERAGEVVKNAFANGGATLVVTVTPLPEGGLSYQYFSFSFLSFEALKVVLEDEAYQTQARQAEEKLRKEITPVGPMN